VVKFIVILLLIFPIIYHTFKPSTIIFKEVDVEMELAEIRGQIEKIDSEFRKIGLSDEEISELKADDLSTGYITKFGGRILGMKISNLKTQSFFDIIRKGSVDSDIDGKTYKISVITGYNSADGHTSDIPADSEINERLKSMIYDKDKSKILYDINEADGHTNTLYFMDDRCFGLVYDYPIKNIPYQKFIKALKAKYGGFITKGSKNEIWYWETGILNI